MTKWQRLLTRHGFLVEESDAGVFDCRKEQPDNAAFLIEMLERLAVPYEYEGGILTVYGEAVTEKAWLAAADTRGRGGTEWIQVKDQPVRWLDAYMAGLVRQFNRLGLETAYCCDGHERRSPYLAFMEGVDVLAVERLLAAAGANYRVRDRRIIFQDSRKWLPDFAEQLGGLPADAAGWSMCAIRQALFNLELERCLAIDGQSREEAAIRSYVAEQLKPHVDYVAVDPKGNLLAQRTYGSGHGPALLLNAHLDTIRGFAEGREILKDGDWWMSSEGILGADDRAGVAVLLCLARWIQATDFNGTIKFIFTVEEEIGLKGAKSVVAPFLWGVDAAFVIDRRGAGDIVTSCGGYEPFCDEAFGSLIEQTALSAGLKGGTCTPGGSSDTRIWAEHGIQSVNLSAGYINEHTPEEALNIEDCFQTLELLLAVLKETRAMRRVLRDIRGADPRRGRPMPV